MKNPEGVGEGKRKQEVKRNSQDHEAGVRVQWEKIQSGRKKDKRFEGEGGMRVELAEGCQIEQRSIPAGGVRGGSHTAGWCGISKKSRDAAGRAAPGVRVFKSSESRKRE